MCGIHGNELAWVQAVSEITKKIKINKWITYFIFANLKAIEQNVRQTEKNMNRCFYDDIKWSTYEDIRTKEILPYLQKSDYLLDLHSSTNRKSVPFLISEYKELSKLFPVEIIASWFDKLHPWGSDGYINSIWKIGICLESGSIEDNNVDVLKESIINFLKYTWNISWDIQNFSQSLNQKSIHFDKIYKNKSNNFKLNKNFWDFETIKKWDIIWFDDKEKIIAQENWIIVFAHDRDKKWEEAFILGKEE